MLYWYTIQNIIDKYGFEWSDVENIKDHERRVRYQVTCPIDGHTYEVTRSLEYEFYISHMGRSGFDETGEWNQPAILAGFLEALEEAREAGKAIQVVTDE